MSNLLDKYSYKIRRYPYRYYNIQIDIYWRFKIDIAAENNGYCRGEQDLCVLNEQKEGVGWEKDALELLKNELVKLKHCLHKTQIQRQAYAAQHQTTKKQCNSLKRQQKNLDAKQKSGIQSMELHINRNDLAEQKKLMHHS